MSDEEAKFNKLLEALGEATESIEEKINNDEFLDLVKISTERHPLMYLPDLLNDFINGVSINKITGKPNLSAIFINLIDLR